MIEINKNVIYKMIQQKGGIAKTADFVFLGIPNKK
jgi:hypothetical protein